MSLYFISCFVTFVQINSNLDVAIVRAPSRLS